MARKKTAPAVPAAPPEPSQWPASTQALVPAEPLLSPDWYRVADLRPRLRPGVRVAEQLLRGEAWYVLSDPISGRHLRFNAPAWALIKACNGQQTLDALWSQRVASAGDDAPSQAETIQLLGQAFGANLLLADVSADAALLIGHHQRSQKKRKPPINPLSFKVPLWNPNRQLARWLPAVAWLYTRPAAWLMGALLAAGALGLALQAQALTSSLQQQWGQSRLLLLVWLLFPLVKAVHEMAHAFAVKAHGGAVHELGLSLLALNPVPYVDASAANAFSSKRARMSVAAAGIVAEGLMASAGLLGWVLLEPGLARDAALALVVVGALSSLLVNGNPLLPFDGYHLLCDAAELPNLGSRSNRFWRHLLKTRLLRLPQPPFGHLARGELPWLLAYAPLAWVFRTGMLVALAALLAQWSAPLGLLVLAWGLWMAAGRGLLGLLRWLAQAPELQGQRPRALGTSLLVAAALGAGLFALPLPDRSQAPGVVWLPDDASVRAGVDGEVLAVLHQDGDPVQAGQTLVQLGNEPLQLQWAQAQQALAQARIERSLQFEAGHASRLAVADDEIARLQAQARRVAQQVQALTVRAAVSGRLVLNPGQLPLGRYLAQGDTLAHVLPNDAPLVRALVRNDDIALVRARPGAITVQLAHGDGQALPATLVTALPQATTQLPTAALGEAAGGPLALDPSDAKGQTTREPLFQFDLRLPAGSSVHVGARALVQFQHGQAPAATLAARFLRRAFLRHFER